jgi:hypothetical protein
MDGWSCSFPYATTIKQPLFYLLSTFSHELLCRFFLAELLDIPRDRAGVAMSGLKRLPVYVL